MLDWMLPQYLEAMAGKSLPSLMEEVTGISAKTWKKGLPKRSTTLANGRARGRKWLENSMQARGFSENETRERAARLFPENLDSDEPFSSLIQAFQIPGVVEFERTLEVAAQLDEACRALRLAYQAKDAQGVVSAFAKRVLPEFEEWCAATNEAKDLAEVRQAIECVREVGDCLPLLGAGSIWALFKLLACWDVEFFEAYLSDEKAGWGMAPQPMVTLLMLRLSPRAKKISETSYRSRGLVELPLARLLDLCFCTTQFYVKKKWPSQQRVTRTHVAASGGVLLQGESCSDQPLAKLRRGQRGISLEEFAEIWMSMTYPKSDKAPRVPAPWYAAAQLMTVLCVRGTKAARIKSVLVLDPSSYFYWWQVYFNEAKAKGVWFGSAPWPPYLRADQSFGSTSPDSNRSFQSSGCSSQPLESQ